MNYFSEEDHKELAVTIAGLGDLKWFMTYDVEPLIRDIYQMYRIKKMALSYSACVHTAKAEEYIIFSNGLSIPSHPLIRELL